MPDADDATYFVSFEISPARRNPMMGHVGGGFASCWIRAGDVDQAQKRAREEIARRDWRVEALSVARAADSDDFTNDDDRRCFAEAQGQGLSIRIETFGLED